jgi:hypothetical protein
LSWGKGNRSVRVEPDIQLNTLIIRGIAIDDFIETLTTGLSHFKQKRGYTKKTHQTLWLGGWQ